MCDSIRLAHAYPA